MAIAPANAPSSWVLEERPARFSSGLLFPAATASFSSGLDGCDQLGFLLSLSHDLAARTFGGPVGVWTVVMRDTVTERAVALACSNRRRVLSVHATKLTKKSACESLKGYRSTGCWFNGSFLAGAQIPKTSRVLTLR